MKLKIVSAIDSIRERKRDFPQKYSVEAFRSTVTHIISSNVCNGSCPSSCLAHNQKMLAVRDPLVISHNGASGVYVASSDLAYQQAI
ncbi:hypothetical protein IFM89_039235 [Coptis chinensis]|uniref:GP-PDE domain-containing protein n=1 Tax=Coptis chinensis TaxID=261450 RepID=A0A835IKF1_9MAGN|nr:hypothetical protein IFM89_039235 [Coptis chinensis]